MTYTKADLVTELHAVARIFDGERAARLLAAAEFIAAGATARTPQREIVARLDALGVDAEMEITLPATSDRMRSGTFRVDIGVYQGDVLVALCECKAHKRELVGRQRENYDGCGLPYIVAGNDSVDEAVEWLCSRAGLK